jgi:hypothetical protein
MLGLNRLNTSRPAGGKELQEFVLCYSKYEHVTKSAEYYPVCGLADY